MIYKLGRYVYKNYSIYKKIWGPFKKRVLKGPFSYRQGVIRVNRLNGIEEPKPDYSHLTPLDSEELTNNLSGNFLVNFKEPDEFFGNDPWPAEISPYKERLLVKWSNGSTAVIDVERLNVWRMPDGK